VVLPSTFFALSEYNLSSSAAMSAPQQITPAYLGSSKRPEQSSNPLVAFWREQVIAPEHRSDNLKSVLASLVLSDFTSLEHAQGAVKADNVIAYYGRRRCLWLEWHSCGRD